VWRVWIVGILSQLPMPEWLLFRHQFVLACIVSLAQLYGDYIFAKHVLHKVIPKFEAWWGNSNIQKYAFVRNTLMGSEYVVLFVCGANPAIFPINLIFPFTHATGAALLRTTRLRWGWVPLSVGAVVRLVLLSLGMGAIRSLVSH
jgi:hypothetical protein